MVKKFKQLNVLVPPEMAAFSFGDKPLKEGDSASVQCSVTSGDLPVSIFWFYNTQPIENSEYITISRLGKRVSALTIDSVSHSLVGNYTCLGQNAAGEAKQTAPLLVNGLSTSSIVLCFLVNTFVI